ncbi:MAG: hypothetical protein IJP91_05335, partial [Synergistaceae bacterium]|nr:hypothetical protein [Synergistaceae bacterium]
MITAAGLVVSKVTFFAGDFPSGFSVKSVALAAVLLVFTHLIRRTEKFHPVIWIAFSAVVGILFKY